VQIQEKQACVSVKGTVTFLKGKDSWTIWVSEQKTKTKAREIIIT